MILEMTIRQGDNGWILSYTGHDILSKEKVFANWSEVLGELEEYFGWWDMDGKHSKKPKGR